MDEESIYEFDTCGWTLLPGVLTAEEVAAATVVVSSAQHTDDVDHATVNHLLDDHPTLCAAKRALIGPTSTRAGPHEAYKLDSEPSLLQSTTSLVLCGGRFDAAGRERRSRAYVVEAGIRRCRGLRIVWALEDTRPSAGGIHVISGSHRSNLPAPEDVVNGTDTMGLLRRIEMQCGDLLLLSSALLYAVRPLAPTPVQQLLVSEAIAPMARSSPTSLIVRAATALEAAIDEPAWLSELNAHQRAVLGFDSEPPAPVEDPKPQCKRGNDEEAFEKELWYFDLTGMLILKNVMDAEWLQAAHAAYEWGHSTGALTQPPNVPPTRNAATSERLYGGGSPPAQWTADYTNPLLLPEPHADPFRRMLAHPAVMSRLDWMLGQQFRLWGPPSARETPVGGSGQLLHGGLGWSQRGIPADFHSYHFANGHCHAEAVNVAWQLCDQRDSDGGFVILPGSAKGHFVVPESMHHMQVTPAGLVHPHVQAGDVVLFLAYACTHGAFAWQGDDVRRGVFFQYHSRHIEQPNPVLGGFKNYYTWASVAEQLNISVSDDARTLVSMATNAKSRL